jgi:GxxExxY protein
MPTTIHRKQREFTEHDVSVTRSAEATGYSTEELADEIVSAAMEVHRALGTQSFELAYQECLAIELAKRAIPFVRQVEVPCCFKCGFHVDFIVDERVIVELRVNKIDPIHETDLLTCMRLTETKVGLVINFSVEDLKQSLVRRVL